MIRLLEMAYSGELAAANANRGHCQSVRTQAKKEVTGAVSIIDQDVLDDVKPVRIEQAIQGRSAGVQVTSGSGAPGCRRGH